MVTQYAGSTAVVTGSASGIGRAVARRLVDRGVRVVGLDRRPGSAVGVDARGADLAVPGAAARALEDVPSVDMLFSCAGVTGAAGPETTLLVNVVALREVVEHVLERMPDGGAIVNVASVGGWRWERNLDLVRSFLEHTDRTALGAWCSRHAGLLTPSAYPFSKQCVVVETLLRSAELAPRRIRVNAVSPSLAMHPFLAKVTSDDLLAELTDREAFKRAAEPWEVANVMVFLASDYASYMTGEVVAVSSQQA